jgi:hypothetical protein
VAAHALLGRRAVRSVSRQQHTVLHHLHLVSQRMGYGVIDLD